MHEVIYKYTCNTNKLMRIFLSPQFISNKKIYLTETNA